MDRAFGDDSGVGLAEEVDPAYDQIENGVQSDGAATSPLTGRLEHLEVQERAQELVLRRRFAEQEHGLRQNYADWIIRVLGAQLFVADAVFVALAWAGWNWELSSGVIEVWLAATVVQIVGVVAIVTRHLFPNRDGNEARA
jgi:hypothetical protein